jgi:hypothetical protein
MIVRRLRAMAPQQNQGLLYLLASKSQMTASG